MHEEHVAEYLIKYKYLKDKGIEKATKKFHTYGTRISSPSFFTIAIVG
jgi:hypothetical protein